MSIVTGIVLGSKHQISLIEMKEGQMKWKDCVTCKKPKESCDGDSHSFISNEQRHDYYVEKALKLWAESGDYANKATELRNKMEDRMSELEAKP
jgi:hypothetical protein